MEPGPRKMELPTPTERLLEQAKIFGQLCRRPAIPPDPAGQLEVNRPERQPEKQKQPSPGQHSHLFPTAYVAQYWKGQDQSAFFPVTRDVQIYSPAARCGDHPIFVPD